MSATAVIAAVDAGVEAIELAQQLITAAQQIMALPGFGTPQGVSKADLASLRLQEGAAQAALQATIDKMPD
jgi:hypothetical protein